MKKLSFLIAVFGIFTLAGSISATTADQLQPAATITHNEDLVVNGTGTFSSLRVGREGEGGVTFFNGTIVNSTTTEGEDNPITFGDNVRIDGSLFRTEIGGDNALRVADSILPAATNLNDLGSSDLRFKDLYLSGNLTGSVINPNNISASDSPSSGEVLSYNSDSEFEWIDNSSSESGIKAKVYIGTDRECERYWTYDSSEISCSVDQIGSSDVYDYYIEFEFRVDNKYWLVDSNIRDGKSNLDISSNNVLVMQGNTTLNHNIIVF